MVNNITNQLEMKKQIEQTIEVMEEYASYIEDCRKDKGATEAKITTLRTTANDPRRRDMSTVRAVIMGVILVAVFAIDYILFYPVIGFLITYAFTGTPQGFWLDLARVIIPLAFLIIELNIAYFRGQERTPLGSVLLTLGSILFGAVVPVALAATFIDKYVSPETRILLAEPVFNLLLFFLVVLAGACHYGVIFRGEPIVLAMQVIGERWELRTVEHRLSDLENQESSMEHVIVQNYVRYRLLVHSYRIYDSGEPFNGGSPFSDTTNGVLRDQFSGDIPYFEKRSHLFV